MPVSLKSSAIVEAAVGKTCQYHVIDNEVSTRVATGTVMYETRDNAWVVTCNEDTRDERAPAACDEVLAGWVFK